MVARMMRWVRGEQEPQDDIPVCRLHGVPMEMVRKVGNPARFTDQETVTYTLLFRCTVPGCDETAERRRIRNQIPVPGETTERPTWAERDRKSI